MSGVRPDFAEILRLVRPGSRVLDVGCGAGDLLEMLVRDKGVDGRGVEISPEGVSACLARGLSVMQGDADRDLDYFPAAAFDYVILSQALQAMARPRHVLGELLRIGAHQLHHARLRLAVVIHASLRFAAAPQALVGAEHFRWRQGSTKTPAQLSKRPVGHTRHGCQQRTRSEQVLTDTHC